MARNTGRGSRAALAHAWRFRAAKTRGGDFSWFPQERQPTYFRRLLNALKRGTRP